MIEQRIKERKVKEMLGIRYVQLEDKEMFFIKGI